MKLIHQIDDKYSNYLSDESKEEGYADSISFPACEDDVISVFNELPSDQPITFQGANTGVEGRSVPHGGHVMNFSHMNQIIDIGMTSEGEGYAVVEPGVTLEELSNEVRRSLNNKFFWPPSPTEASASIGGIAASGAYGMNVCHYGMTDQYIKAVTCINRDGSVSELNQLPPEDTAITKLTLRLLPKPEAIWGIAFFFEDSEQALKCADELQSYQEPDSAAWINALEYIDNASIQLVEKSKDLIQRLRSVPSVPENTTSMIIVEICGEDEAIEAILMELMDITANYGCDPDTAWALLGEAETEKLHALRHGIPESVILYIEGLRQKFAAITKLGFRTAAQKGSFSENMLSMYKLLDQKQLNAVLYAHIRTSDIQINILPENEDDYLRGKAFIEGMTPYKGGL